MPLSGALNALLGRLHENGQASEVAPPGEDLVVPLEVLHQVRAIGRGAALSGPPQYSCTAVVGRLARECQRGATLPAAARRLGIRERDVGNRQRESTTRRQDVYVCRSRPANRPARRCDRPAAALGLKADQDAGDRAACSPLVMPAHGAGVLDRFAVYDCVRRSGCSATLAGRPASP